MMRNGAGKTTALRMLATLLPIDAGQARIFGVDVTREPHRVRQLIVEGLPLPGAAAAATLAPAPGND